jgi:hypothetical protein
MASPPPPYDDITGISRTVMKDNAQTSIVNYNGNARPGEIVADLTQDPPTLYIGNNLGQLSLISSGSTTTLGCFHKMANVTADAADTVYNFDWFTDVTQHVGDRGVTVTSGEPTRVNISTAGDYLVQLEMIIKITGNAERNVFLWLAKNGNDIAETGVKISLRQGNNPVYQTIAKPWLLHDINANDYIQLRFAVSREDGISLEFTAAQTSPYVRPAIPSAVFTVTPVGA